MLAYAACAMSFALAMMFLIKDNMKTETFLAATSAMITAIYISMMIRFRALGRIQRHRLEPAGQAGNISQPRSAPVSDDP